MSNFNKGDLEAAIAKAKQHKTTGGPDAPGHIFAVGLIIGMSAGQFAKMDDLYNACKWDCETVDELLTFINKQPKDGGSGGGGASAAPSKGMGGPAKLPPPPKPKDDGGFGADPPKKDGKIMMGNSKMTLAE